MVLWLSGYYNKPTYPYAPIIFSVYTLHHHHGALLFARNFKWVALSTLDFACFVLKLVFSFFFHFYLPNIICLPFYFSSIFHLSVYLLSIYLSICQSSIISLSFIFEAGSYHVALAGLELFVFLPLFPKWWDYRCAPLCHSSPHFLLSILLHWWLIFKTLVPVQRPR